MNNTQTSSFFSVTWVLHEKGDQTWELGGVQGSFLDLEVHHLHLGQGISCEVEGLASQVVWSDLEKPTSEIELSASNAFTATVTFHQPLPVWSAYQITPFHQGESTIGSLLCRIWQRLANNVLDDWILFKVKELLEICLGSRSVAFRPM